MDNTLNKNTSQANLPPGLYVGVIPNDDVQLILPIWLQILDLDPSEKDAFLKKVNRLNIPKVSFCRQVVISAKHIRQLVMNGEASNEASS